MGCLQNILGAEFNKLMCDSPIVSIGDVLKIIILQTPGQVELTMWDEQKNVFNIFEDEPQCTKAQVWKISVDLVVGPYGSQILQFFKLSLWRVEHKSILQTLLLLCTHRRSRPISAETISPGKSFIIDKKMIYMHYFKAFKFLNES